MVTLRPFNVWWADLGPAVGHEQDHRRPVVIVSGHLGCQIPNGLIWVVPCTRTRRGWAWQPEICLSGRNAVAMCDQLRAISTRRLVAPIKVALTVVEIESICYALRQLAGF